MSDRPQDLLTPISQSGTVDIGPIVFDGTTDRISYDEPRVEMRRPYWKKNEVKVVATLNIGDYEPQIRELTYPLMKHYARKIGAHFVEITERRYPECPIVYEKLQCRDICRDMEADWVMYIDADTLINPEAFDVIPHIPDKGHVCFNGRDMSGVRSFPDKYFLRDGRFIGACNWLAIASDWTADDLWRPLDDISLDDAKKNIFVSVQEHNGGQFKDHHLIDDYTLSRNIARFGLKHVTLSDICGKLGWRNQAGGGANPFFWHSYSIPANVKLERMLQLLTTPQQQPVEFNGQRVSGGWELMSMDELLGFKKKWGMK